MPLPFLTADRAFDAADDLALPYHDRDRWQRPYRPGPWRVGAAALWLLLASFVLFAAVIIAFTGSAAEAAVVFGIALAVIVGALRLLRVGAWVSTRGLRHVGFFATRTTPWAEVVAVRTVQGQALILVRRGRAEQEAPVLMTTHNGDFLARQGSFDRAADMIEAWAAENGRH